MAGRATVAESYLAVHALTPWPLVYHGCCTLTKCQEACQRLAVWAFGAAGHLRVHRCAPVLGPAAVCVGRRRYTALCQAYWKALVVLQLRKWQRKDGRHRAKWQFSPFYFYQAIFRSCPVWRAFPSILLSYSCSGLSHNQLCYVFCLLVTAPSATAAREARVPPLVFQRLGCNLSSPGHATLSSHVTSRKQSRKQ